MMESEYAQLNGSMEGAYLAIRESIQTFYIPLLRGELATNSFLTLFVVVKFECMSVMYCLICR